MKNLNTNIICFGEMLWDILPSGKQAGGAPFNVAVHLKNFGIEPQLISKVGTDDLGKELLEFVREKQISTRWVQIGKTHLTGVVKANINDSSEVIYKIVQPVAWDYIQVSPELESLVAKSDYFIYGSLISRQEPSQATLYQLLDIASYRIFDVNLRPPHYEPERIALLLSKADMVKMNHHELAEITSWFTRLEGVKNQMEFLRDRFELDKICVSLGEKGACLLVGEDYYQHPAFLINVVDTIGSGDSFLASFIYQLISKSSYPDALRFACATGALVATYQGATPHLNQEKVKAFIEQSMP